MPDEIPKFDDWVKSAPTPSRGDYDPLIIKHAQRTGLDPDLVRRLTNQESRFKRGAVSPKGASGLMQLMPATAKSLGVKNIFDPDENIRGGTDYLKQQLDEFGDVPKALAAYNAGPGAVRKYGGVPPYKETQNYVKTIGGGYQGTGYAQGQKPQTAIPKFDDWAKSQDEKVVAPGRGKQGPMVVRRQAAEAANPQVSSFDPAQPSNAAIPSFDEFQKQPAQPQSPYAGVRGGITRPQSQPATGLVPGMGGISRMRTRPKPVPSSDRMAGAGVSGTSRSNVEALMSSPQANPFGAAPDPERDAANNAEAQKRYSQLLTANAAEVARVKDEARKEIQNQGGWTPETDKWLAETFSRGESHFNELLAGGVRPFSARKFNQLWSRAEGIRQAVEEESQGRSATSKWAQGTLAGLTSPEMAAAALHVPPEIAFGGGAGLSSLGRGESSTQAANATRQGAVEGALFRGPAIGKNVVTRALTKGGTVGAGTYALTGDPAAAASNAVFAASGPILHGEGAPERSATTEAIPASKPREFAPTLSPSELAKRTALRGGQNETRMGSVEEGIPQASVTEPAATEAHPSTRQNRRVRNVATGTKGQFAKGFKEDAVTEAPAVTQERPNAPLIKPATIEEPQITPAPAEAVGKESPATASTPAVGEVPIPPPVKAETVEKVAEPSTTSARKAQFAEDRAQLDLPELPAAERKSWQTSLAAAKPEKATTLADEVLTKPRALNDEETASLVVRAQQIKNEHAQVMKEIGNTSDPAEISTKRAQSEALQREFDKITEATKKSGTEKGRTLAAQKLTINQDFDLVSVKQRIKAAKGRELTPKESKRYEKMVAERDQAVAERDKAIESVRTKQLQREITRSQRQRVRAETKEQLDAEAATIKQNIAAAFQKVKSQQGIQPSGLAGLDPEGLITKELVKYARNRVKANVGIKAEALIDEVHSLVKDFADRREIAELISGYKLSAPERKPEDVRRLAEIRSEIQRTLKAVDVEKGRITQRRQGPRASEKDSPIFGPKQGPRMSEKDSPLLGPKQGPKLSDKDSPLLGPRQGPKLSDKNSPLLGPKQGPQMVQHGPERRLFSRNETRLKQLQAQEAELSRRIEQSDFSPRPKKPEPLPYTRDVMNAQQRVKQLEAQFKAEELRAQPFKYWLHQISGLRKAGMLSGFVTHLRNIGGTAAYQAFEEGRRVPSVIADAAMSTVTGRRTTTLSPSAMLDGVTQSLTVGLREARETMKLGAPREVLEQHQFQEINTGLKVVDKAANGIFRFMSASDRVFYQGSFKRNLVERAQAQAKTEARLDDSVNWRQRAEELTEKPSQQLEADAKHDALVSTFNNNNKLSDAIKRGRGALDPVSNFALDMILPFDRTPTNVIARVIEASPAGYLKNAGQLARSMWNRKMTTAEQRSIAETFGRATTGTAIMALGTMLAAKGLLDTDDYGTTYLKIGSHKINLSAAAPLGTLLGVGAGLYRASSDKTTAGKGKYASAVLKPLADTPILSSTSRVSDMLRSPERSATKFGADTAFSFVPLSGMVRNVSQFTRPENAAPKTFGERFKANIPIVNRSIPIKGQAQRTRTERTRTRRTR